jgi:hypothetical protein
LRPNRIQRDIKAVRESTLTVVPQINETKRTRPDKPENEKSPYPKMTADTNTLPVGTNDLPDRIGAVTGKFPAIGPTGFTPPDPNLGVGRTHIVAVVNSDLAFFSKTGLKIFQQTLEGAGGFFGSVGAGNFVFDPKCFYDRTSRRFFVVALDVDFGGSNSAILVGVSQGENPSGTWFKYKINVKQTVGGNSFWMDYPSIGNSNDAIAVCGNMFGFSGGWNGVQFVVLPKAPMLVGNPVTATSINDVNSGSAQVGRTPDVTSTRIFGAAAYTSTEFRLYAINNPATSPTINFQNVTVPAYTTPRSNARSAGGVTLDALDGRVYNVVVRGTRMFAGHTIASSSRLATRWYQFNLGTWPGSGLPVTAQSGNLLGTAAEDYHMNAIETNGAGDASMIFTRSGDAIVADIMITGRRLTDPAGSMSAPRRLIAAEAPSYQDGFRWGDYFDMAVDPIDDLTFWGMGMTANPAGNWLTHIFSWQISSGLFGREFAPVSVSTFQGRFVSGEVSSVRFSDNIYYNVGSVIETGLGSIAAMQGNFNLAKPASAWQRVSVSVEAKGVAGATGMIWLWNFTTNKWDHVNSFALGTADVTSTFTIPETQFANYIDGTGQVRVVTRGLNPFRRGRTTPFTYSVDRLWITAREAEG